MKRKLLLGAIGLLGITTLAQAQHFSDAKFGIKGGWNSANITNSREGNIDDSKRMNGFNAGIVGVLPLGQTFAIRTGLELQSKGAKTTWIDGSSETSYKTNPMYLELPVNFTILLPFNERVNAYIGAGPYAAVGIAGKNTTKILGNETKNNIEWGNDNPLDSDREDRLGTVGSGQFKRFDFGVNAVAGIDFGRIGVQAQYGFGLANTIPGSNSNDNANKNNQHRVLGVSGIFYF